MDNDEHVLRYNSYNKTDDDEWIPYPTPEDEEISVSKRKLQNKNTPKQSKTK